MIGVKYKIQSLQPYSQKFGFENNIFLKINIKSL